MSGHREGSTQVVNGLELLIVAIIKKDLTAIDPAKDLMIRGMRNIVSHIILEIKAK